MTSRMNSRTVIGGLTPLLSALYDSGSEKREADSAPSTPRVAKWLGDIREFFPTPVVQIVQKDAFDA